MEEMLLQQEVSKTIFHDPDLNTRLKASVDEEIDAVVSGIPEHQRYEARTRLKAGEYSPSNSSQLLLIVSGGCLRKSVPGSTEQGARCKRGYGDQGPTGAIFSLHISVIVGACKGSVKKTRELMSQA
jgi:hypothetical protein